MAASFQQNHGGSDAQETTLVAFFGTFQMRKNRWTIILENVIEKYFENINFLVSTIFCYMEVVESKPVWISELDYEVTKAKIDYYAKVLLESPKNPNVEEISMNEASSSASGTWKKRKGVVIKQENIEGSELERAQHEHERINIQEALKELQKVILGANFNSSISIVENVRNMINSFKGQIGSRSTKENLEDIKKKCVDTHHIVVK